MDEEKKTGICRVCLSTVKKKSMSLFQEYKSFLIYNHINAIANIQIKEDDGLPDKICKDCLLDLETAINFKQKCESSNIILQTSTLNTEMASEIDIKEVIIKKEEPQYDGESFFMDDEYFGSDLYGIAEHKKTKPLNKVELGLRPSRAIDLQLQCDDCKEFFKTKCKLRVHWKKVHQPQILKCNNCKRTFRTFKAFNHHQKNKSKSCLDAGNFRIEGEGKTRLFYCKECEYKSIRIKDMITHWVVHTGDRPYKCEICGKTCTQQSSLQAHKESAHKEYKTEIACHYCGKLLKGRNRIYRHLKIHTDQQCQCHICQKFLKNKSSLRIHMQRHSGVKSFTCEKCAISFYTSAELANHKRTVHNKGKYWYNCDLCDYKSIRNEAIKRHRIRHTGSNIPCTVCGMFFESTQKLILHQRRHFEEKRFACPHCNMKFFRRDSVGKHVRAKHKCMMEITHKPSLLVKKENPVVGNQFEEIIEIDLTPGNTK